MSDIAKEARAYSGRRFSYVSEKDPFFKRWLIRAAEKVTGKDFMLSLYHELLDEPDITPFNVYQKGIKKLGIHINFDEAQLSKIPKTGPLICIANHPFGIVDGGMLLALVTQVREDYFMLANEVLTKEPLTKAHWLPVDFRETPEAKATNKETKRISTQRIKNGECLIIFPAGAISTAKRPFSNQIEEWPWKMFICPRIHDTQATVVPFYFHGTNSRLFHVASHLSMTLRLGLLIREVKNKMHQNFRVEIGNPIPYSEMEAYKEAPELIEYLKNQTLSLKDNSNQKHQ